MLAGGFSTRRYERFPSSGELDFSLTRIELGRKKEISSKAEIINTSEAGLCIKTTIHLEVGNILTFNFKGKKEQAMVKWVLREEGLYIGGLMFLQKKL